MMTAGVLLLGLTLALQPASVDEADASEPVFSFPEELQLVPLEIQEAADAEEDADSAAVPEGLSAVEEALYRAQLAWVNEDWSTAMRYAQTAAVGGDPLAAVMAGLIAQDGRATGEPDLELAVTWLRRAAETDQPVALFELGQIAMEPAWRGELGSPRYWFERAARGGHMRAMLALGDDFRSSGVPQDMETAREWFERAARGGSAEGMYQFAQMLDQGEGGHQDQTLARQWYEMAASDRHAEAALQAAIMWAEGDGGPADDAEARRLMQISAESGYAPAQGQFGLMLFQGRGGEADSALAGYWFEQGARGGDAESQFLLAYVLAQGDGRTQDLDRSYFWALRARHDPDGESVSNPMRERLIEALERSLPAEDIDRIRAEAALAR